MESFHKKEIIGDALKHWFEKEKRIFPWRGNPTPYSVWVSEIMLQQTRASVVVPYFLRWMERFPTVQSLAESTLEEVMKMWEGLGYYSRARALHEGAKYIVTHFQGEIPAEPSLLKKIKGIGPYTAGAIQSFAFHQKSPAIDGNVMRVIARLYCFEKNIDTVKAQQYIRAKVEELLPDHEPWVIMEALIELGATLCGRIPECRKCPFNKVCLGYQKEKADLLPIKKEPVKVIRLRRFVPIIHHDGEFLLQQHEGKKVMSGLCEFPYFEDAAAFKFFYPEKLEKKTTLKHVTHTFTRYRVRLIPSLWSAREKIEKEGFFWIRWENMKKLPFSSGHRKILRELQEEYENITY